MPQLFDQSVITFQVGQQILSSHHIVVNHVSSLGTRVTISPSQSTGGDLEKRLHGFTAGSQEGVLLPRFGRHKSRSSCIPSLKWQCTSRHLYLALTNSFPAMYPLPMKLWTGRNRTLRHLNSARPFIILFLIISYLYLLKAATRSRIPSSGVCLLQSPIEAHPRWAIPFGTPCGDCLVWGALLTGE